MSRATLIDDQRSWQQVAARLESEPVLALDTESNSLHAYRERVCLIQIATGADTFLLDPLAVTDLSALGRLLDNPSITKVAHGSDYDVRCLHRDYGFTVRSLFDTEMAARFVGSSRTNLASVLENVLGVEIPKSRQLQTSNWGHRPLSPLAMDYAINDVKFLPELGVELHMRLSTMGRLDWVMEECRRLEQVRHAPSAPAEVMMLRIKGSSRLGPRSLAVLKQLFIFREEEGRRMDCPPSRVLSNEALITLADTPDMELHKVSGLPVGIASRAGVYIREAIDRGMCGPLVRRPRQPKNRPWEPEAQARVKLLKLWRSQQGTSLGLDPALVWPAASLERLADSWDASAVGSPDHGAYEVRNWQRHEFSQALRQALNHAFGAEDSAPSNAVASSYDDADHLLIGDSHSPDPI